MSAPRLRRPRRQLRRSLSTALSAEHRPISRCHNGAPGAPWRWVRRRRTRRLTDSARNSGRRRAMIYRSPYPEVEIPDLPLTPFVLRHAERLATKPALIDGPSGRTLTYGELADGVRRVASGLARRDFRRG